MARQAVNLIYDNADNNEGARTYELVFDAIGTDGSDRAYAAGSWSGVPSIGSAHPDDANAYCNRLSVRSAGRENPVLYTVTAFYSDKYELDTDPTDDTARAEWDGETYEQAVFADRNGDAILNSAGDAYIDPIPTRDQSRRVVTVQKKVASVPSWMLTYQDVVNDASFTLGGLSIGAGLAKLSPIRIGHPERRNGTAFYPLTMIFHLDKDGWPLRPLDAGFREVDGSGNVVNIQDANGDLVSTPVPLDGSGAVLEDPTPSNAVHNEHDVYDEADFSVLPLT